MPELGDVRRENHRGGYSLWCWVAGWENGPEWVCVYSTHPGDVGQYLSDQDPVNCIDVGKLPGMDE